MKEGAPVIHAYRPNNVSVEYHWNFGDVEKAFARSHIVREDRFETGKVITGFLEPPASLAYYDPSGYITVWPAKQSPYFHYRHLAACFNLPLNRVRTYPAFHRRGLRRDQERLRGGGLLRGDAVEKDRETGQVYLFHGRGAHHVPEKAQHGRLQQDGHDEGRHPYRGGDPCHRQRRRLHRHRSPHHVPRGKRQHPALQAAQF